MIGFGAETRPESAGEQPLTGGDKTDDD